MPRPRVLDTFCKAGGAARGYADAGFEVVGVDIEPQPNYPYRFIQADAIEFLEMFVKNLHWWGEQFDLIHASPPCQAYSVLQRRTGKEYPELADPVRELLIRSGKPYVIENVVGAPLRDPVLLCGSTFELPVERHRLFETNWPLTQPSCRHDLWAERWPEGFPRSVSKARLAAGASPRSRVVGVYGTGGGAAKDVGLWRWAMDIDWMTKAELAEAIPPAYTEYVGTQWLSHSAKTSPTPSTFA